MSTITQTGNLASKPELRNSSKGNAWTEARVLHTERIQNGEEWHDGVTPAYSVRVFGTAAKHLVAAAEANEKNLRVRFSGRLLVLDVQRKDGSTLRVHDVEAEWIDPLFGQDVVLTKGPPVPPVVRAAVNAWPETEPQQSAQN